MRIAFLNDDRIAQTATELLQAHHPSGSLPIPIEDIIDVGMRVNIYPLDGISRKFEVAAYVTADLKTIVVDERVQNSAGVYYRFSLAHELAHIVLHGSFIQSLNFSSVGDWKATLNRLTDQEHYRLERQANLFAGCILMPAASLRAIADSIRDIAVPLFPDPGERALYMTDQLAAKFFVSTEAMGYRMREEEIEP